jgi:hypothetical protein
VDDVKRVIDTAGRFTDDEIFDAISDVDDLIYIECGTPMKSVVSDVGMIDTTEQDTYYVGEENIYRVDRVLYGTATKTELYLDDAYKANTKYGMVRILPVASGGPVLSNECEVEIRYVPRLYNRIATYRSAKHLLEKVGYAVKGSVSRELEIIEKRLATLEQIQMEKIGVVLSSDYAGYDSIYGVNTVKLEQDHQRNRFIGSTGW